MECQVLCKWWKSWFPTAGMLVEAQNHPESVFVNILRSPGIDSQLGGQVEQPYLSYRSARLPRLAESIPRNRFLSSVNVYKYGLRILRFFNPLPFPAWNSITNILASI
jgi:hypothetical protein